MIVAGALAANQRVRETDEAERVGGSKHQLGFGRHEFADAAQKQSGVREMLDELAGDDQIKLFVQLQLI